MIFFGPKRLVIFCPKRLHNFFWSREVAWLFLSQKVAWYFFLSREVAWFFFPKRLRNICLSQEVAWFIFVLGGCMIFYVQEVAWFFGPKMLHDFFCPKRLCDFCVSWEVAWLFFVLRQSISIDGFHAILPSWCILTSKSGIKSSVNIFHLNPVPLGCQSSFCLCTQLFWRPRCLCIS